MKTSKKQPIPNAVPAKIFMPVLLSMLLFIGTFFGYILPKVESHLMDRKREMIHALSESAMGSIRYYAQLVETHSISKMEAQLQAASHLKIAAPLPTLKEATQLLIHEALKRSEQNQSTAATMLGISQQALSKRLKNMGKE